MDTIISSYLSQLDIGDPVTHDHMTVFPLFHKTANGPDYITLEEALEQELIIVEEIDKSGSVPNLKVTNKSSRAVLLFDGEEAGRWAYRTQRFAHSDHISSYSIRSSKMASVSASLKRMQGHYSDQGQVWHAVAVAHLSGGTSSPTGAMKDMYEQRSNELKEFENAFECLPGQRGCAVCLGGEFVAVDTLILLTPVHGSAGITAPRSESQT